MIVEFDTPIKIVSEANNREHWAVKMKRKQAQQIEMDYYWKQAFKGLKVDLPVVVHFTRLGFKKLDDDNLRHGHKGVRDHIAKLIGIDDGSDKIEFQYDQESGHRKYGLRVKVFWGDDYFGARKSSS